MPDFGKYAGYLKHLSGTAISTLMAMINDPDIAGATDPGTLTAIVGSMREFHNGCRMLQLGTYIGFSTVVFGDVVKHMYPRPGRLVTVDPDRRVLDKAKNYAKTAGLTDEVVFVEGKSTDPVTIATLSSFAPFDVIYIDSSHAYGESLFEIKEYLQPHWLAPNPIVFWHDAGENARAFDPTRSGGVRRALNEVFGANPEEHFSRGLSITETDENFPCGLAVYVPRNI